LNHPGPFFVACFCLITGTLCIFCCNLNLNFWCFMSCSWYRWNIAESGIKHQKFKFKLQQKIHNVPVIKQKHATKKKGILYVYTSYLLTLPLFTGVSRLRAFSPAWTRSHARETLISRTHLFFPHDIPPTKKSSTIKSWPTFCDQYFSQSEMNSLHVWSK
jgi:hypothetical protein